MIEIGLSQHVEAEIRAVLEQIAATPKQARQATRRALDRLGKHMQTVVRRDAARRLRLPQKSIKGRILNHLSRSRDAVTIWAGVNRLGLSAFGAPRQTRTGVKVGRLPEFRGAFVGRGKLAGRGVFIRFRSPHFDPARYRTPKKSDARTITRALGVPIEDEVRAAFAAGESDFRQFFGRAFQGELARAMEGKR